jgi:hypothetical protein
MRRNAWLAAMAVCTGMLAGCVERRFVVETDPPGALVLIDNKPTSPSPADIDFVYYGKRKFTMIKDGYQTLEVIQEVKTPWYEYPLIDFATENLVPYKFKDIRHLYYKLQPCETVRADQLLQNAEGLKNRAATIGPWEATGFKPQQ